MLFSNFGTKIEGSVPSWPQEESGRLEYTTQTRTGSEISVTPGNEISVTLDNL